MACYTQVTLSRSAGKDGKTGSTPKKRPLVKTGGASGLGPSYKKGNDNPARVGLRWDVKGANGGY